MKMLQTEREASVPERRLAAAVLGRAMDDVRIDGDPVAAAFLRDGLWREDCLWAALLGPLLPPRSTVLHALAAATKLHATAGASLRRGPPRGLPARHWARRQ